MNNKEISQAAIEAVKQHEISNGRNPEDVSLEGVGFDIKSIADSGEERFIEVKGISESWKTYNWQPLYYSEVECLKSNPEKFYLYIVYFDDKSPGSFLYIIPGNELLKNFNIKPMTFSLSPISRRKLLPYKVI